MKASNAISSSRTARPEANPENAESSSSIERFTLSGPSAELDPRYDAYRGDLADAALASRLFAPHYARPVERKVSRDGAGLFEAPSDKERPVITLTPGEIFALLDEVAGWAWGYRASDHRVGYVVASQLEAPAG